MALKADAVELYASVEHRLREVEERGRLCTGVLNVVLVDVELGGGVGGSCSLKTDVDVCRSESVVEHIRAPGSVVIAVRSSALLPLIERTDSQGLIAVGEMNLRLLSLFILKLKKTDITSQAYTSPL